MADNGIKWRDVSALGPGSPYVHTTVMVGETPNGVIYTVDRALRSDGYVVFVSAPGHTNANVALDAPLFATVAEGMAFALGHAVAEHLQEQRENEKWLAFWQD
jgi:hypothetical protein